MGPFCFMRRQERVVGLSPTLFPSMENDLKSRDPNGVRDVLITKRIYVLKFKMEKKSKS
jgi:hypothetical protein